MPPRRRFHLTGEKRRRLLGAGKGEGPLLADNQRHQIRILASRAEHPVITTNPRELAELEAQPAADGMAAAVSAVAGAASLRNGHGTGW